ncbi:MAG TPA: hypothetical protein VJH97_02015 [Candidatus Nanoarchaeia archaeon]|nr:hypothetical protein [Candidatus Nanoarchaeia archaeon]
MSDELFKDFEKYKKGEKKPEKTDEKEIVIRFKFKPLMIERLAYWVVIVALLVLLFINPLAGLIKSGTNVSSAPEITAGDAIVADTVETEEPGAAAEPPEDTDTPVDKSLSGKITLVITEIVTEADEAGVPKKVKEVLFSMDNQDEDFRPRFKIFWYDSSDPDEIKDIVRADATFPTLLAGEGRDYKITKFISSYLSMDNAAEEKLYVRVYDAESEEKLQEASKTITD